MNFITNIRKGIKGMFGTYIGLPNSVYVLFFASIVNNTGNFVAPFLTLFLSDKLGLNTAQTGFFVSFGSFLGIFGALLGGRLIDTLGRKKVLIIFQTSAAVSYILCVALKSEIIIPYLLLAASFCGAVSSPVYSTIVNDVTKGEQRNAGYSLMYLAMNIGFAVGPLMAGFLYNNFIEFLFVGDSITTFISIFLIVIFVPETKPDRAMLQESRKSKSNERAEEGNLFSALYRRPALVMFSFITILYFMVFSQFTFGLSLQTRESFGSAGSEVFGVLMTTNALVVSIFTVFISSITKKNKPAVNMAFGGIFYALGFGMMFFINGVILFVFSAVIWTIGEILISTNTSVYIAENTPMSHRGRFNSVFPIIRKAGFALGPIMAGTFIKYFSVRNLWLVVLMISLAASALMYCLRMYEEKKKIVELEA